MAVRPDLDDVMRSDGDAVPLELERFMPYRLAVLSSRVSQAWAAACRQRFGISLAEWRVLAVLGRDQPLSAGEVAARSRMNKVKVSRAIGAMERKGLLRRGIDPDDQRAVRLVLSAEGRQDFSKIAAFAAEFERALLAEVDPALNAALDEALGRLTLRLDRLEGEGACRP